MCQHRIHDFLMYAMRLPDIVRLIIERRTERRQVACFVVTGIDHVARGQGSKPERALTL